MTAQGTPPAAPASPGAPGHQVPVLVDLGSGPHVADGWIAIDGSWGAWLAAHPLLARLARAVGLVSPHHLSVGWPERGILCRDVRRPLPFATGSVRAVFAAHLLEHLTREDGARLLTECGRVLEPGGTIRVIVPDVEMLVRWYVRTVDEGSADRWEASHRLLTMLNVAGTRPWPSGLDHHLARLVTFSGHRALYDRHSLARALEAAGFGSIERRGPLESAIPLIDRVERPAHHEVAVCLEATWGTIPGR